MQRPSKHEDRFVFSNFKRYITEFTVGVIFCDFMAILDWKYKYLETLMVHFLLGRRLFLSSNFFKFVLRFKVGLICMKQKYS